MDSRGRRPVLGDVDEPHLVRCVGGEPPLDPIVMGGRVREVLRLPAVADSVDPRAAHEMSYAFAPDPHAQPQMKFGMHPRGDVALLRAGQEIGLWSRFVLRDWRSSGCHDQ